jgi:hypothetical protein
MKQLQAIEHKPVNPKDKSRNPEARFDLSQEELRTIELDLVAKARESAGSNTIYAFWINPAHPYADFVRTYENMYFPEVEQPAEETSALVEEESANGSLYLALVDTRPEVERVVLGMDLTGLRFPSDIDKVAPRANDYTGFYTIDSLIKHGNFSAVEFYDYCQKAGIDLDKSFSMETNFRIGDKAPKFEEFSSAQLGYRALFQLLEKIDAKVGSSAFFATMNRAQRISLHRAGIKFEPLMGRSGMVTEESLLGIESLPSCIYYDEALHRLMTQMPDIPESFLNPKP